MLLMTHTLQNFDDKFNFGFVDKMSKNSVILGYIIKLRYFLNENQKKKTKIKNCVGVR